MSDRPPAGRRRAALTLVVLTPLVAELALGSTPLHLAFLVLLWLPIYGAGVLLIREAVRRCGGRWPSLVLLGVAYELVEDGLGLQALSSPRLYDAAQWGPRLFGLNTTYWEANVAYHVVFSVLIPIALTDLLFPGLRNRPYLRRGGLVGAAVCAVLGVLLLRVSVPPSQDPGYTAPLWVLAGCLSAVAVLAFVALRVLPGRPASRPVDGGVPSAPMIGGFALLATVAYLALTFPPEHGRQPAGTQGLWVLLPMAVAVAVAACALWLVDRWSRTSRWSDRNRLWLIGGALLAHTGVGAFVVARTTLDRWGLVGIAVLTVLLLAALSRRIDRAPDPRTGRTGARPLAH